MTDKVNEILGVDLAVVVEVCNIFAEADVAPVVEEADEADEILHADGIVAVNVCKERKNMSFFSAAGVALNVLFTVSGKGGLGNDLAAAPLVTECLYNCVGVLVVAKLTSVNGVSVVVAVCILGEVSVLVVKLCNGLGLDNLVAVCANDFGRAPSL